MASERRIVVVTDQSVTHGPICRFVGAIAEHIGAPAPVVHLDLRKQDQVVSGIRPGLERVLRQGLKRSDPRDFIGAHEPVLVFRDEDGAAGQLEAQLRAAIGPLRTNWPHMQCFVLQPFHEIGLFAHPEWLNVLQLRPGLDDKAARGEITAIQRDRRSAPIDRHRLRALIDRARDDQGLARDKVGLNQAWAARILAAHVTDPEDACLRRLVQEISAVLRQAWR